MMLVSVIAFISGTQILSSILPNVCCLFLKVDCQSLQKSQLKILQNLLAKMTIILHFAFTVEPSSVFSFKTGGLFLGKRSLIFHLICGLKWTS
jgi:hypothetical protein